MSGEVIFWPGSASGSRKSRDFRKIRDFPIRAPIDHFLRGKCDKCPPRVRRVKSGFPKNGHASGRFLDKNRLCTPLFWPKIAIKGRTEPLKIRKNRVFFTFFQFFVIFRHKSDPNLTQNRRNPGISQEIPGNPGNPGISCQILGFPGNPGISGKSWDFRDVDVASV